MGLAADLVAFAGDDVADAAEALLAARAEARAAKDWARADAIRDRLKELGLVVEDTNAGRPHQACVTLPSDKAGCSPPVRGVMPWVS